MPVSEMSNVGPILSEVVRLNPRTIVDLGVGFGKMGVLCREALDAVHGRCNPPWGAKITGVEGFEAYRNPAWQLYDEVLIANILDVFESVVGNDLVMMIDSLEHLDKPTACIVLEHLVRNNKQVIVSVPLGNCPQGTCFGNELETHRSTWSGPGDFRRYSFRVLHQAVCCVVSIKGELNA